MTDKPEVAEDMIKSTLFQEGDEKLSNIALTDPSPVRKRRVFGTMFLSSSDDFKKHELLQPAKSGCNCFSKKPS